MLRVAVMVGALAAFFSAAVFLGGDAVGAWDAPRIAPDTPDRAQKGHGKRAAAAARLERTEKRRAKRVAAVEARWVAQVDALCLRASREVTALPPPTSPAEADEYLRRVESMNRRLNDAFAALEPPRALAPDARRVLSVLRRDERLLRRLIVASDAGDALRVSHAAASLQEAAALESALLIALGAKRCDAGLSPYSHASA